MSEETNQDPIINDTVNESSYANEISRKTRIDEINKPEEVEDEKQKIPEAESIADKQKKEFTPPEHLTTRYLQMDNTFLFRDANNSLAFIDKGERLITTKHDVELIRDMIDYAKAKDWVSIHLKGTDEFKQNAWLEASLQGLTVTGYKPSKLDLTKLNDIRAENRIKDSIAPNPDQSKPDPGNVKDIPIGKHVIDEVEKSLSAHDLEVIEKLKETLYGDGVSDQVAKATVDDFKEQINLNKVYVGAVVDFGKAPFEHNKDNADNYYIRLKTATGETDVWGVDLRRAIEDGKIKNGEDVVVANQGSTTVIIKENKTDDAGNVTTHDRTIKKNIWAVEKIASLSVEQKDSVFSHVLHMQKVQNKPVVSIKPDALASTTEKPDFNKIDAITSISADSDAPKHRNRI